MLFDGTGKDGLRGRCGIGEVLLVRTDWRLRQRERSAAAASHPPISNLCHAPPTKRQLSAVRYGKQRPQQPEVGGRRARGHAWVDGGRGLSAHALTDRASVDGLPAHTSPAALMAAPTRMTASMEHSTDATKLDECPVLA